MKKIMNKFIKPTKIIFLAIFALSLALCIYEDAIMRKSRCLVNTGVLAFMINACMQQKKKDNGLSLQNQTDDILDSFPIGAFYTDTKGKCMNCNPIIANLLQKDVSTLVGSNILVEYFGENKEVFCGNLQYVLKNKKSINYEFKPEKGLTGFYRIYQVPFFGDSGNVKGIMVFLKNISDEKEIIKQRNQFIAALKHDLKTPVIAQIRSLNILCKETADKMSPMQKELLNLTLDSTKEMYDMISSLLNSYKFENNEISLHYSEVNITEMIIECCEQLSDCINERKIKILIRPNLESKTIIADPEFLKIAILYLIENSVSHDFKKSKIMIEITEENEEVVFKVHTDSPHLSKEQLLSMFEKSSEDAPKYGKIGLSPKLNYAYKIIKAHLGEIIAVSCPVNNKNTFGFKIPKIADLLPLSA